MKKTNIFVIILTAIITSMFFFPFEFTFLRMANTKMVLAALGLVIFVFRSINSKRGIVVTSEFFTASIIAGIFSLTVLFAIIYNNTNDYAYTNYIVSMWVWLFAAYTACVWIENVHGYISIKLVVNYLIAICVAQCIIALLIDNIAAVKSLVDSFIMTNAENMEYLNRLYGIGAALDVAGTRFSAVLLMIAVLLCHDNEVKTNKKQVAIYMFAFILIAFIGSMIARTTNIGMGMGVAYICYASEIVRARIKATNLRMWGVLISVTLVLIVVSVYLYNNVASAYKLFRFAFEAPINWIETGEWRTDSTDVLKTMWVYPESLKTWIFGDGYFLDPVRGGYYMETDVGYLRFIFHCGLIGLSVFSAFFIYIAFACYKRFSQDKMLFLLLLILNFAIWAKVATDIFLVFAIFMCIPMVQQQTYNQIYRK